MDLELNIHGIYDSTMGSDTLFFHWDYVKENRSLAKEYTDVYSSISILVETPESVPTVIAAIDDQFRGSPVQTRTETERAFALGFLNMMGNIKAILLRSARRSPSPSCWFRPTRWPCRCASECGR